MKMQKEKTPIKVLKVENYLNEKDNLFEFEGVKLTKDLVETLRYNQEDGHAYIRNYKSYINELIHFLIRPLTGIEQEEDKVLEHIVNLSRIKEFLDSCDITH